MITEKDLQEAIAECQGQRNPNANTCIKLAAYLTIQKELFGEPLQAETAQSEPIKSYSYQSANNKEKIVDNKEKIVDNKEKIVDYPADTEFGKLIDGQTAANVWGVMQELMDTLQITNPKLYNFAIRKLEQL